MEPTMNKAKVQVLAASALILCVILFSCSLLVSFRNTVTTQTNEQNSKSYAETHSYQYKIGEVITLNSHADEEGESYGWVAGFDWDGTIEATLDEVKVYKQSQFGLLEKKHLVSDDMERQIGRLEKTSNPMIVCYQLTLHSINASSEDDELNVAAFSLNGDVDFASYDPIYLKGTYFGTKNYDGTNGYRYKLAKGKTITITVGYLVDPSVKNTELSFSFGESNSEKYVVKIRPSDIREVA